MSRVTEPIEDVLEEWGGTQDAVNVLSEWRSEIDAALREAQWRLTGVPVQQDES